MEADWLLKRQPAECGLNAGTSWCLRKPAQVKPTGMAVNDERIYRAMRSSPKAEFFLREHGVLKDVPLDKVGADYRFRYVISAFRRFMGRPAKPGTAIVQTRKPLPEEAIKYWLERW
jgi:hypothetical protein